MRVSSILQGILIFYFLSLWDVQAAYAAIKSPTSQDIQEDYTPEERKLLDLTNKVRARKGLQPLTLNRDLTLVAREQSADMAHHRHLSHTVKGKTLAFRIQKSGYPYRTIGENIARSKGTFPHVIHMWMKSPGHRRNLLGHQFEEVGFGITKVKNGDRYFTQVFGAQK